MPMQATAVWTTSPPRWWPVGFASTAATVRMRTVDDDRDREAAVSTPQEQGFAEAFVELSDTLVADYDVVEFLHLLTKLCVDLLGVRAAGIMIADQRGSLRVVASPSRAGASAGARRGGIRRGALR